MNNKGVQLSLNAVVGLILALLILYFTFPVILGIYNVFVGSPVDEVTMSNWDFLLKEIESLQKSKNTESVDILLHSSLGFKFSVIDCGYQRVCICHEEGCDKKIYKQKIEMLVLGKRQQNQ